MFSSLFSSNKFLNVFRATPALWAWIVLSAALYSCGRYLLSLDLPPFPVVGPHFLRNELAILGAMVGGIVPLAAAWAGGRLLGKVFPWMEGSPVSTVDRQLRRTASGIVALAFLGYVLALSGIPHPWVLRGVCIGLLLSCGGLLFKGGAPFLFSARDLFPMAGFVVAFLFALLPETFGDVLHYVLAGPDLTLRLGRWSVVDGVLSFGFPGFSRAWYLWPLAWGDDRAAKFAALGMSFLWALSVGVWTGARWGAAAGRWATALLGLSPIFVMYAGSSTAEPLSGFLLWMGAARLLECPRENGSSGEAVMGFFFFGAATAAKPLAVLAAPAFLWLGWRCGAFRGGGKIALSIMAAASPLIPWGIENFFRFGNPFYPYFPELTPGLSSLQREGLSWMLADQRGPGTWLEHLWAPFRAAVTGVQGGRASFTGPVPVMLLPLLVFFRPPAGRSGIWRGLLVLGLSSEIIFSLVSERLRFALPLAGAWAAIGGVLLSGAGRWVRAAVLAAFVMQGVVLVVVWHRFYQGTTVFLGQETAEEYRHHPTPVQPAPPAGGYDWLSSHGNHEKDKVWLLGEFRAAGCPLPSHAHTVYDVPLYVQWDERGLPPESWPRELRALGINYVLINEPGLSLFVRPGFVTVDWREKLDRFRRHLEPVYHDEWVVIYRVP